MLELEALVSVVVVTVMFATIFGIFYMKNRENMALIERGINPRESGSSKPYSNLKYGLLLCGSGLGLLLAFFIDKNVPHKAVTTAGTVYYQDNPEIYFALIAIGGGLGLVISYWMERKDVLKRTE